MPFVKNTGLPNPDCGGLVGKRPVQVEIKRMFDVDEFLAAAEISPPVSG
jgi:hypothetical protein